MQGLEAETWKAIMGCTHTSIYIYTYVAGKTWKAIMGCTHTYIFTHILREKHGKVLWAVHIHTYLHIYSVETRKDIMGSTHTCILCTYTYTQRWLRMPSPLWTTLSSAPRMLCVRTGLSLLRYACVS